MLLAPGAFPGGRGQRAGASLLGQGRVGNQGTRRLPSPSSSLVTPPCARHASLSSSRLRNRRGSPRLSRARFSRPGDTRVPSPTPAATCTATGAQASPSPPLGSGRLFPATAPPRCPAGASALPVSLAGQRPCSSGLSPPALERRLPSRARDAASGLLSLSRVPCPQGQDVLNVSCMFSPYLALPELKTLTTSRLLRLPSW